jgi:micrococcal nuclease
MLNKEASQLTSERLRKKKAQPTIQAAARQRAAVKTMTATKLSNSLYFYQAIVRSVYDGDTITVDIDLGLHIWSHGEKLRLLRINTPELRGSSHEAGVAARDFLRSLVEGRPVVIETFKDDKEKYGRYLAEVWVADENGRYYNVNDCMVKEGHAEYKEY